MTSDPHHGFYLPPGVEPGYVLPPEMIEKMRRGRWELTPEEKAANKKLRRNFMRRLRLAVCLFLLFVGTVISCGGYASKHPHHLAKLIPAALFAVALLVAIMLLMVHRRDPGARR